MSVADEIKARLDLVAYVSESIPLKKAGRNYKACCPFHQERTPSFVVFPETQTWRCFGACGEGGDIFSYAMKQHGWEFKEAMEHLAQRAGIELQPRTPEQSQREAYFDRLLGLLDETAAFYHRLLVEAPEAKIARDYIERRGLNAQTLEAFQLGYAPDGWQHTLQHLSSLGYRGRDIVDAGIAIRNDRGRVYDRFRHRLMIPIRDGRGRVIGFGARALRDEDNPKYLNSPQNDLFDKSKTLYGLDMARREIRETETAIIVEGYMDVMQAHQAGFRNVVAQMGTALTTPQLQSLRRYADRLILALDADQAGVNATMRGLNVARESLGDAGVALFGRDGSMQRASRMGIDIRVIVITSGKDPDDLIRENPDEWQRLVNDAEPVADYVIRMGLAEIDPVRATVFEKEKVARKLLPLLTATESDLQKEANVQKLAMRLHLPIKRLMEIARETRTAVSRRRPTDARIKQRGRTRAMDQAKAQYSRSQPPPPQRARSPHKTGPAAPPPEGPRHAIEQGLPPEIEDGIYYEPVEVVLSAAPPGTWEEGPRPASDWLTPPEDTGEDDEGFSPVEAAEPSSSPVTTTGYRRTRPASPEEGYLLSMLLRRPELLYQANRALREVANEASEWFKDDRRKARLIKALNALQAEDFHDTANQAIFSALQEALNQDTMEPIEYIREAVGTVLHSQIDWLWALHNPVEQILPQNTRRELQSVRKEMRKQGRVLLEPEAELAEKTFSLRMASLRTAIEDLRFVALEADEEDRQQFQDAIDANQAAIRYLDKALQERNHLNNG